jgi:beta-mannosidase
MARARILGSSAPRPLVGSWQLAAVPPGLASTPGELETLDLDWIDCDRPMPAAGALRAAGRWSIDDSRDFDAEDWWYRCEFSAPASQPAARLRFDGLATVADVWLNGRHVLHSDSMFLEHVVDVAPFTAPGDNTLVMRFHALAPLLAVAPRRPRARWRTALVASNALRWYRTSLLGRMPAWCPPVAPVGPWRPISLETSPVRIHRADVHASMESGDGRVVVELDVEARHPGGHITVAGCGKSLRWEEKAPGRFAATASLLIPQPERWWPHTHGEASLHRVDAVLDDGGTPIDLGHVGFRTLRVDRGADGHGFGLVVNDVDVFSRGVCWAPLDVAALTADRAEYRAALVQLRAAGANMVRVPGVMTYEPDVFHDLCDELGLMVWQDLMFASMDYPWADEHFAASATREAMQVVDALQSRPSLTVICGSSEVDQQAAMLGLPAAVAGSDDIDERLAPLVQERAPDAIWLATSPSGGAYPFQADVGVSHYYGVGAYRRPFDDARRSRVRFAAECLAFANVPERATVDLVIAEGERPGSHPRWKARVPRDAGAAWDFEEVRDHYLEQLFAVDPMALRERDGDRYLALGRIASGEAMRRTLIEWRRPGSSCRGALIWLARDLWAAPGWGLIDATGREKAAYWFVRRACAPIALLGVDEGLNGLWLHAINDTAAAIDADLRVALYRGGLRVGEVGRRSIVVPAHGAHAVHANLLFDGFLDLTYSYRFGSPQHDVVVSTLRDRATGALLAEDCYAPGAIPVEQAIDPGLSVRATIHPDGCELALRAERLACAVAIDVPGFTPDDNYLTLEPAETRRVRLRRSGGEAARGTVAAINSRHAEPVDVPEAVHAR